MRSISLLAPAKINLYLEIVGNWPPDPQYHELVMVMQSIGLCDCIRLRGNSIQEFRIFCDVPELPRDRRNLAYRAAEVMAESFPDFFARYGGVDIDITKQIPLAAGLAGGSSDAAAVLVGLDLLWELGLTQGELQDLGLQIGSDVPFCIAGGTALTTGRGERVSPLPNLHDGRIVLAKYRKMEVSTGWAYTTYRERFGASYPTDPSDFEARQQCVRSGQMLEAIARQDFKEIGKLLHNDLENIVLPDYPLVAQLREAFAEAGVLGTLMSGSGPSVFALVPSAHEAERVLQQVRQALPDPNLDFWTAELLTNGIHLDNREESERKSP